MRQVDNDILRENINCTLCDCNEIAMKLRINFIIFSNVLMYVYQIQELHVCMYVRKYFISNQSAFQFDTLLNVTNKNQLISIQCCELLRTTFERLAPLVNL